MDFHQLEFRSARWSKRRRLSLSSHALLLFLRQDALVCCYERPEYQSDCQTLLAWSIATFVPVSSQGTCTSSNRIPPAGGLGRVAQQQLWLLRTHPQRWNAAARKRVSLFLSFSGSCLRVASVSDCSPLGRLVLLIALTKPLLLFLWLEGRSEQLHQAVPSAHL